MALRTGSPEFIAHVNEISPAHDHDELILTERRLRFRAQVNYPQTNEYYRRFLMHIRCRLMATVEYYDVLAAGALPSPKLKEVMYTKSSELSADLLRISESLYATGDGVIADGRLRDVIRQVKAFGLCLVSLDIRSAPQHSGGVAYISDGSYAVISRFAVGKRRTSTLTVWSQYVNVLDLAVILN